MEPRWVKQDEEGPKTTEPSSFPVEGNTWSLAEQHREVATESIQQRRKQVSEGPAKG